MSEENNIKENKQEKKTSPSRGKTIGRIIAFVVLFAVIFVIVCIFLKMTEPVNVASLRGLYQEEENSLDVVLIGASEVYADYCAPLAYKDYGYTSYSYAVSGVPGSMFKSMIKEVKKSQDPKLFVVEMNGLLQKDYYYEREGNLHGYIDNIKYSSNRDEVIEYAITDDKKDDYKISNFLSVYHNSWKDPEKCFSTMFTRIGMRIVPYSTMKGYATFAKTAKSYDEDYKKKDYFTNKSKMIIEDLLDYCDETNTKVLFVRFPHQNKETTKELSDEISSMVNAHGYEFIDFSKSKDEAGIIPVDDYYNDEHFNARGTRKFTKYFGEFLTSNYDVVSNHTESTKTAWEKCVNKTEELFTYIEDDIDKNLGTYYYELSVYLPRWSKVKPLNQD